MTQEKLSGILPVNKDGFENGDYENFALVYIGDSKDWIHPKAEITEENPISGKYSLRWNADDIEQHWMFVSNAFYTRTPYEVSVKVRINAESGYEVALLGAIEGYDRDSAIVDALRLSDGDASLDIYANAANQVNGSDIQQNRIIKPNTVYKLSMDYRLDGKVWAEIVEDSSGEVVVRFAKENTIKPNGIGLLVHLDPAQSGSIIFDDFEVDSASYQMEAGKWTKSPQFVIFRRFPDALQGQGEWVGAASAMYDEGIYKLWYRIRRADVRGKGYGYATSKDGLNWDRYEDNPVIPFVKGEYSSCEKISVLKVDGQYKAWYTVNAPKKWHIIYATSDDGINWTEHGDILNDANYKDPDVIYVDGTYYMYVIHPTGHEMSVLTSKDGIDWVFGGKIAAPGHTHPAAYYVKDTGKFWMYEDIPEIMAASSDNGIKFGEFQTVLTIPPVGLDDNFLEMDGVNYPTFYRNGLGHLESDKDILMVYQARHSYLNNRPNWKYAQDGKLVLAGKFTGLHVNVTTSIYPDGRMEYSSFPIHCQRIDGMMATTNSPIEMTINSWNPDADNVGSWTVKADTAHVKYHISGLSPDCEYSLIADDKVIIRATNSAGEAAFEADITISQEFQLKKGRQNGWIN